MEEWLWYVWELLCASHPMDHVHEEGCTFTLNSIVKKIIQKKMEKTINNNTAIDTTIVTRTNIEEQQKEQEDVEEQGANIPVDDSSDVTIDFSNTNRKRRKPISIRNKIYPNYFAENEFAHVSSKNKKKFASVNVHVMTDKSRELKSTGEQIILNELQLRTKTKNFWRRLACISSAILVLEFLLALGFLIFNLFFVKPIVRINQVQIYRVPVNNDTNVGFIVILDVYNTNWKPVYLENCTFQATITDTEHHVSYDLKQPIMIGKKNESNIAHHSSETQLRYKVLINLQNEADSEEVSNLIMNSVRLHASHFFALKFDGACEVKSSSSYRWTIAMNRNQQYNLKNVASSDLVIINDMK
jgi:hypothetical protein